MLIEKYFYVRVVYQQNQCFKRCFVARCYDCTHEIVPATTTTATTTAVTMTATMTYVLLLRMGSTDLHSKYYYGHQYIYLRDLKRGYSVCMLPVDNTWCIYADKPENVKFTSSPLKPTNGGNVTLSCSSTGVPTPKYRFYKFVDGNKTLIEGSRTGKYTLSSISYIDYGGYNATFRCIPYNSVGIGSSKDLHLDIQGKVTTYIVFIQQDYLSLWSIWVLIWIIIFIMLTLWYCLVCPLILILILILPGEGLFSNPLAGFLQTSHWQRKLRPPNHPDFY